MPCGDTVSTTVQYTVLQIDRSCCISTSLTATSEATSWALPPLCICCCCLVCTGLGIYAIQRGHCPGISRRLDVLRSSGSSSKQPVCDQRRERSRIYRPRSSDSFGFDDQSTLDLHRDSPRVLENQFRLENNRSRSSPKPLSVQPSAFDESIRLHIQSLIRTQPQHDDSNRNQDSLIHEHIPRRGNPFI
ncbi:FAST protein [Atlantic halibut reovirus]|nr:FAST protein [Atlantic halibut reovirus]